MNTKPVDESRIVAASPMVHEPRQELFMMLDLYYRLHWWMRDSELTGRDTGDVRLDIVMERRKALEWVMDLFCDWDSVEMST